MGTVAADAVKQREAAETAAQREPNNPVIWLALSRACQAVGDEPAAIAAARRARTIDPDRPEILGHLAAILYQNGPGAVEARPLFERLLERQPRDPVALHYLYLYAMFDGDFPRAASLAEALDHDHPGDPNTAARIARAYQQLGERGQAQRWFTEAVVRCDTKDYPFPYGPYAPLKPMFARLAGGAADWSALSRALCQDSGVGLANLSNPRYPPDCEKAIERLRSCIRGRDLCIFGNGPSLSDVVKNRDSFGPLDVVAMSMSSFQIIDDDIMVPAGKRLELACMTHPVVVMDQARRVEAWFASVPGAMLALPVGLMNNVVRGRELRAIADSPDRLFWFDCFSESLPPSPSDPLHFPAINTLMCALGVAVIGAPRRIFLFGFDGQTKGEDLQEATAVYYRDGHEAYHAPHRKDPAVRRLQKPFLWWDTLRFNESGPVVVRQVALLFNVPIPPIYNVCPDSALDPFPRISFERFRQIAAGSGLR